MGYLVSRTEKGAAWSRGRGWPDSLPFFLSDHRMVRWEFVWMLPLVTMLRSYNADRLDMRVKCDEVWE